MTFFADPIHEPFALLNGNQKGALLLHGFVGTPAEVRPLGEFLARENISSRAILLPGFGREINRLHDITRADWLAASRAAWTEICQTHEETVLIGYSLGASLAVHLAADNPPDRLILLAPFWRYSMALAHWFMPLIAMIKPHVSPFDFGADLDDPAFRANIEKMTSGLDLDDPANRQRIKEEMRLPTAVLEEVRRLGQAAHRVAGRIGAPTLVIQGTRDEVVLPRYTRQLVHKLRQRTAVHFYELPVDHEFPKNTTQHHGLVRDFLRLDGDKWSPHGYDDLVD